MNNKSLARIVIATNHDIVAYREKRVAAIEESNERMAFPKLGFHVLEVPAVEMRLKTMFLRSDKQVDRETSLETSEIDLILELRGSHGRSPEGENARNDRRAALIGMIREKWDL